MKYYHIDKNKKIEEISRELFLSFIEVAGMYGVKKRMPTKYIQEYYVINKDGLEEIVALTMGYTLQA